MRRGSGRAGQTPYKDISDEHIELLLGYIRGDISSYQYRKTVDSAPQADAVKILANLFYRGKIDFEFKTKLEL